MHELLFIASTYSTSTKLQSLKATVCNFRTWVQLHNFPGWTHQASVTMILQKGRLFFRQILRRRKGLGTTREHRGKGTRLSLILNDWTSSNYSSKTASESLWFTQLPGCRSSTKVRPPSLQVLPSFCATFSSATWHAFLNPERSLPE